MSSFPQVIKDHPQVVSLPPGPPLVVVVRSFIQDAGRWSSGYDDEALSTKRDQAQMTLAKLKWQTAAQREELAATGFATYKALAQARGVPLATLIRRVRSGIALSEAADPRTRVPPIAKNKRKSEKLSAEQMADIEKLGFDSVRGLSAASKLSGACIYGRLRRGWSVDQAINAPPRVTKPLSDEKREELHARGFSTVADFARAAMLTVNQVWDRWVRKGWSLDRVFEEPIRECVAEALEDRASREERERSTGLRACVRCGEIHPLQAYRASPASSNARWRVCSTCVSFSLIEDRYGLDRESYERLWEAQDGRCYGCRTDLTSPSARVHVEHDHSTGEVRGLACAPCNWTLGDFRDNAEYLRAAATWLDEHPCLPEAIRGEAQRSPAGDARGYTLWRDHCMSIADLEDLIDRQHGRCGICGTTAPAVDRTWVVDHHHGRRDLNVDAVGPNARQLDDGRARSDALVAAHRRTVRGVLCSACNKGVGHALEDKGRLLGLAVFMEAWASRPVTGARQTTTFKPNV